MDFAAPNDEILISDIINSGDYIHSTSRGSNQESQVTQPKKFKRLNAWPAATTRLDQNLCNALQTKSKLSKSLNDELDKFDLQIECLIFLQRNVSLQST